MIIRILLAFILVLPVISIGQGQTIHRGDFEQWTTLSRDSSGRYHYHTLLVRFSSGDTTLSSDELILLTHGYTLQPEYTQSVQSRSEDSLSQFNLEGQYHSTIDYGLKYIHTNPVSLTAHFALATAYMHLQQEHEFERYRQRYRMLMTAILASGKGDSEDSPFYVINANDVASFLEFLGMSSTSQSRLTSVAGRSYDIITAFPRGNADKRKIYYFDISRPTNIMPRQSQK